MSIITTKGCPQGGVLPPLLWLLVVNEILKILNDRNFQTEGFSDDLGTLLRGISVSVLCSLLQTVIDLVLEWSDMNELSINPNKTKMILFTRKTKIEGLTIPKIKGIPIKLVDHVNFLGAIFDAKMKGIHNLEARIEKATVSLWQCRKAYGKNWGLSPKVMYWIYTTIIRPIILYGSFIWNHICDLKYVQQMLKKFQRLACLAITGAWKSTPTDALEAMLNLPPLHILIKSEAIKVLDRLAKTQDYKHRLCNHTRIWVKASETEPSMTWPADKVKKTFKFDRNFEILIPSRDEWINRTLPPSNGITLYTDGSVMNGSAGAGIHCAETNTDISLPLGKYSTIYLAEIRAIIEACHVISDKAIPNNIIHICSDSESALKTLSSHVFHSALAIECWDNINNLTNENLVKLIWVPAHSGIEGNERADELAKIATSITPFSPEPVLGTSPSYCLSRINERRTKEFIKHWNSSPGCRQAKQGLCINAKKSKYLINVSRTRLKTYTGIITGHFGFNKHLTTIGKRTDPSCDLCGHETETAEHFLCRCPAFICNRRKYLGNYIIRYNQIKNLHPQDILNYTFSTGRFITDSNA